MLHEVLLALQGYHGDLLRDMGHTYAVANDLPFLHSAEREVLNRIGRVAFYRAQVREFIDNHTFRQSVEKNGSSYRMCFCRGLRNVLEPYSEALLKLEREIAADETLTLTYIQSAVSPYISLLEQLHQTIEYFKSQDVRGAAMLDHLHEVSQTGHSVIRRAYHELLQSCHSYLYRVIYFWMLFGRITDRKGEFFVEEVHGRPKLSPSKAPVYLPMTLVEVIFFCGQAIQLLHSHQPEHTEKSDLISLEEDYILRFESCASKPTFDIEELHLLIEDINDDIAKRLNVLLLDHQSFSDVLKSIRAIFFVGASTIFGSLVDELARTGANVNEHSLNHMLRRCIQESGYEEDEDRFAIFSLALTQEPSDIENPLLCERLSFRIEVPQALRLLLTETTLMRFNKVFSLLLSLRFAHMQLSACHMEDKLIRKEEVGIDPFHGRQLQLLRSEMQFWIGNFEIYAQTDVVQIQWRELEEEVASTKSFVDLQRSLHEFESNVQAQLMVGVPAVRKQLSALIHMAVSLRQNYRQLLLHDRDAFMTLRRRFQRACSLLHSLLGSIMKHSSSGKLPQLLLRLDYNRTSIPTSGYTGEAAMTA
eukprot:Clim_evm96s88 gene=Clim_evmTU96s88